MSENKKEVVKDDQKLASASFILGLILVGAAVYVLNTMEKSSDHVQAIARAEKYAQQLIESGFQSDYQELMDLSPTSTARGLASADQQPQILEGGIGLDPWGYPFQYYVHKSSGDQGEIVVWSSGPDNTFQTDMKKIKELMVSKKKINFSSDDFGKVITFKLGPEFANK